MTPSERPDRPQERDTPKEAPETPADEPKPAPVQDPPAEPDPVPYVVRGGQTGQFNESRIMNFNESRIMNEVAKGSGERKERRGFASMSPEKQREIASKGGRAAHRRGRRTNGPPRKRGPRDAREARSVAADEVGC